MPKTKRAPGQWTARSAEVQFKVIDECILNPDIGLFHRCGTPLEVVTVTLEFRQGDPIPAGIPSTRTLAVPYCPQCEEKPTGGVFTADKVMSEAFTFLLILPTTW